MPLEISIPGNTLYKQICITYSFIVDNPNILGNFQLFVGQNQLGENYLTYSHIWGSQNTLGKNMHYIFGIFGPLQIKHACDNFRLHGYSQKNISATLAHCLGRPEETLKSKAQKARFGESTRLKLKGRSRYRPKGVLPQRCSAHF